MRELSREKREFAPADEVAGSLGKGDVQGDDLSRREPLVKATRDLNIKLRSGVEVGIIHADAQTKGAGATGNLPADPAVANDQEGAARKFHTNERRPFREGATPHRRVEFNPTPRGC